MWLARDRNNMLVLFYSKPTRGTGISTGIWQCEQFEHGKSCMYLPDELFSELKWEDEPIEVNLFSKDDKFKLIDSILDYINRFGLKESSTSGIYEHLFADVTEK